MRCSILQRTYSRTFGIDKYERWWGCSYRINNNNIIIIINSLGNITTEGQKNNNNGLLLLQPIGRTKRKQLYDTIRDAVLTTAQKLTWVSLIYRTEPTSNKRKTDKSTNDDARNCVSVNSLWNEWSQSWRRAGKMFSKCLNEAYSLFTASALLCRRFYPVQTNVTHTHTGQLSLASLRGRLIEYQLRLG